MASKIYALKAILVFVAVIGLPACPASIIISQ
jgi:ABC-type nickel/cobalt efflux system permease component RcnA